MGVCMEYSQQVIELLKKTKTEYDELTLLMSYNEVQSDTRYYLSLVDKRNKIEKMVLLYDDFCLCQDKIKQISLQKKDCVDEDILSILNEESGVYIARCNNDYLVIKHIILGEKMSDALVEVETGNEKITDFVLRMYMGYAKINMLNFSLIFKSEKKCTFKVSGNLAYDRFFLENGTHIIKNYVGESFFVSTYKDEKTDYNIDANDIRTDIFRSSGAGGQNINKLDTAVRMIHLPTGISVICQDERSQRQNREKALENLKIKVKDYYEGLDKTQKEEYKKSFRQKIVRYYDFKSGFVTQNKMIAPLGDIMDGNCNYFTDQILLEKYNDKN